MGWGILGGYRAKFRKQTNLDIKNRKHDRKCPLFKGSKLSSCKTILEKLTRLKKNKPIFAEAKKGNLKVLTFTNIFRKPGWKYGGRIREKWKSINPKINMLF